MSENTTNDGLDRRSYLAALAATGFAGLAGCNQGGDADGGETNGAGNGTGNNTDTTTVQRDPVANRLSVHYNVIPSKSQLNPWSNSTNGNTSWFQELVRPRINQGKPVLNGAEYETPHFEQDSVRVHCWHDNYRIEPPYDYYRELNSELSYWDGTPLDAPAQVTHDKLWHFFDGYKFDAAATFNAEATSQFEYHGWHDKGEVPEQEPNPTNQFILRSDASAGTTGPPFHPNFTEPWVQKYEDASTKEAVNSVSSDLKGTTVSYSQYADNGYGSGLYRLESSEDVKNQRLVLKKRDDHPNDYATIEELEIRLAAADRRDVLVGRGEIDLGGGIVQEEGGRQSRAMLPDHIQETDRFLDIGGDQMLINWNNEHLQNLWVRRAIIAAVDWEAVGANGWGAARTIPISNHTGMLDVADAQNFEQGFLDALYDWPMKTDTELATEWMRKAGYTKEGGIWTSPDGKGIDLTFLSNSAIGDWVGSSQTIQQNLQEFGMRAEYVAKPWSPYANALAPKNLNYDLAMQWHVNSVNPWDVYWSANSKWSDPLLGGDPDGNGPVDATDHSGETHDTMDNQGKPLEVQIPAEVGSIEAPERAGANPDLQAAGIDSVNIDLADLVHRFRQPDVSDEAFREAGRLCARYYNYYVPDFNFHQYTWGIWGNVRDFRFPPRGNKLNQLTHSTTNDEFLMLSGSVQTKFDEEYESP